MNKPILSFMMTLEGKTLNDKDRFFLEKYNPVGVSLFARNVENKSQLKKLVDDIKETLNREDVLVSVDQEGGRVRRLSDPEWRGYAPQSALNEEAAKYQAQLIAHDLYEVGINANYTPVLDLSYENSTPAIKSRCFSSDEKIVAKLGKIMLDEYIANGICPCIKHIPGHGRVTTDPHLGLPILNYSIKELKRDFYPFKQLNYSPFGMTAHVLIPEIDEKRPITQSSKGIDKIIRGELDFQGLLVADALDMKALQGSMGEKASVALEAGCDIVCFYSPDEEDIADIANNSKILSGKSLERFEKIKNIINKKPLKIDIEDVADKYYKIVGDIEQYKEDYDATEILRKMIK